MIVREPATTAELPAVLQSAQEETTPRKDHDVEDFLEPLIFGWTEDKFIVSEAIRSYLAEFDADH